MGNRGLETRNSKRAQHPPPPPPLNKLNGLPLSQLPSPNLPPPMPNMHPSAATVSAITVGALEVQNVKRAINRYGTLPKGARIGAYLESLRQTGGEASSDSPPSAVQVLPNAVASNARNVATGGAKNQPQSQQPQMIRSNSSGGVTMTNSATASLNKLQRHRTTTDGSMITFSSFRGTSSGSPKRSANPALADLEFPPPPVDLPPPAEEFEMSTSEVEQPPPPRPMDTTPSPSVMLMSISMAPPPPSNDVSNTEPSVEEASSRFGVSLRRREPSTDSCSSLGSPGDPTADTGKEKLDAKLVAEIKTEAAFRSSAKSTPLNNDVPTKERLSADPAQQLVTELAETMNLPDAKKLSGGVATLPPKPALASDAAGHNGVANANAPTTTNTFKAQLKKVDPKKMQPTSAKEEHTTIIDFKARLRKVENNNEATISEESKSNGAGAEDSEVPQRRNGCDINSLGRSNSKKVIELKKTEIKVDVVSSGERTTSMPITTTTAAAPANAEDEEKRKSTGSISSLKKLWEAKEGATSDINVTQQQQLSPKMAIKNLANNNKSDEDTEDHPVDQLHKKPAVPVKPTKLASIYATPIQVKLPTETSVAPAPPGPNAQQIDRLAILELVTRLETSLKPSINSIAGSQWLQLSDKLHSLQCSCVGYAEREAMAPHSKFQFREVVTRLESQAQSLRSAGSRNVADNERLVLEVGQSLKQISNALHR